MFDIEQLKRTYILKVMSGKLTQRQAKRMINRAIELNIQLQKENKNVYTRNTSLDS